VLNTAEFRQFLSFMLQDSAATHTRRGKKYDRVLLQISWIITQQ